MRQQQASPLAIVIAIVVLLVVLYVIFKLTVAPKPAPPNDAGMQGPPPESMPAGSGAPGTPGQQTAPPQGASPPASGG